MWKNQLNILCKGGEGNVYSCAQKAANAKFYFSIANFLIN